jgi:hypothetical protein
VYLVDLSSASSPVILIMMKNTSLVALSQYTSSV